MQPPTIFLHKTFNLITTLPRNLYRTVNILAETENKSMRNLDKIPSMEAKAKADGKAILETMKESVTVTDTENMTDHKDKPSVAPKPEERMLVKDAELERMLSKYSVQSHSILPVAAEEGDLEIVKMLLEHGAEIDAINSEDRTALQKASIKGHKAVVAYLLDHGGDVRHADRDGVTSVHLAVQYGFMEIAQLLIDSGADLHCRSNGWAPIHLCHDDPEMMQCLLKNGADVNDTGKQGYTALYIAALNNHPEVVKVLLSYNPDLEITHKNRSALTAATERGNTEVVRLLLEAGANVNHQSGQNNFPLQIAVAKNREDILRILMRYNPKVNLVDDNGNTALHSVSSKTSVMIAKILDVGGADLNIRNKEQETPICKAVWFNNSKIIKYLANEAVLDIRGRKHGSPLHIACYKSNLPLVKILVNAGANVNLRVPAFGTPLQSACRGEGSAKEEQESTILYLINEAKVDIDTYIDTYGGPYECAFNAACGQSSEKVVRLMLERGVEIYTKDSMGRMAIHFAAARSKEIFRAMLDLWADFEVADKIGRTALLWASVGGIEYIVNSIVYLSKGSVNKGDRDGWTPLLWAARGSDTKQRKLLPGEQEEVINLLLIYGADPCVKAKGLDQEWSPVKVAKYHGVDGRVIRLLREKAKEELEATGSENSWDAEFHASRKAARRDSWCECCLSVSITLTISPLSLASAHSSSALSTTHADFGVIAHLWKRVSLPKLLGFCTLLQVYFIKRSHTSSRSCLHTHRARIQDRERSERFR